MRLESAQSTRFLELAAVRKVTADMRARGYTVQREARLGRLKADLVARRDGETIVFEFRVPGQGKVEWARRAVQLRDRARAMGAKFRLILVRPPRARHVEVEGIESALEEALRDRMPPALELLSARTRVDDVSDVEIESLVMRGDSTEVSGEGAVTVTLRSGRDDEIDTVALPFAFKALLDRNNKVSELLRVGVDTSMWYGEDDADNDEAAGD
jgi:Holliday junction resolvase